MKRSHQRDIEEMQQVNARSDDEALGVDDPLCADTDEMLESPAVPNDSSTLFLDSFYGIASLDPSERATCARIMIQHCLLSSATDVEKFTARMKDASYALRRLLNGLCSGRAAARQGNASALSSFLKIASSLDLIKPIRAEWFSSLKEKANDRILRENAFQSDVAFVRYALISVTDPNVNGPGSRGRKASEERDFRFGRLFGITAIARSGLLLSSNELDESVAISKHLVSDLIDLYRYKKWMREPVAHSICSLLLSLDMDWKNSVARLTIAQLVENVIIPQLLRKDDDDIEPRNQSMMVIDDCPETLDLVSSFSAEQIAIAICIQFVQRQFQLHGDDIDDMDCMNSLSYPLNRPVFCVENVPLLAPVLSESSSITHPRIHLVWDMLFLYLTDSCSLGPSKIDLRQPASSLPLGETVDDLMGAVMNEVVLLRLLGVEDAAESSNHEISENKGSKNSKIVLDRLSLALNLVRNFSGAEFISSLRGSTRLIFSSEQLETHIFTPVIMKCVFLDVLCCSGKSKLHALKPFALHVLDQMVHTFSEEMPFDDEEKSPECVNPKRLPFAFALLRCDSRFDSRTKTSSVENLLGLFRKKENVEFDDNLTKFTFRPLLIFLQSQILNCNDGDSLNSIHGYLDHLFLLGKKLNLTDEGQSASLQEILGFFFAIAFFNCGSIRTGEVSIGSKKKKKKEKIENFFVQKHPIVDIGLMIKNERLPRNVSSVLPYNVRTVASARLFSLVSDYISATVHSSGTEKESVIIDLLWQVHEMRVHLLSVGGTLIALNQTEDLDVDGDSTPEVIVTELTSAARSSHESDGKPLAKWKNGCAILALTLYMHVFSCGSSGGNIEVIDPDDDDDEDIEEIVGLLNDLNDLVSMFSESNKNFDQHHIAALAELCSRILSCPVGVGNQSRGASPTLLREAVKFAWTGGLSLIASEKADDSSSLSADVINILLNSVGALAENEDIADASDDDGSNDDELSSSSDKDLLFSIARVSENPDQTITENLSDESGDDADEVVDSAKLQALLEEESDVDVDEVELEHHEGADAALAKLIRLKQDARKAGLLARERTEIARQMRCMLLIEVLVVGKEGTWGSLLRVDHVMQFVLPILQYRHEIVKSVSKSIEKGSSSGSPEKIALMNRLTALLRNKILKTKVTRFEWSKSVDVCDLCQRFASSLLLQAMKSNDKEQQALCTSALIYLLRGIPDVDMKLRCASLCSDAVTQWATKRSCKLDVLFLEGFISQYPVLAQACLGDALATAATNGRSPFIKSESYRLLSLLFNPKLNDAVSDIEQLAMKSIIVTSGSVFTSIIVSLNDSEMLKTKRVRDVLRAADKVLSFLSITCSFPPEFMKKLHEIEKLLTEIKVTSESHGVVKSVDNLLLMIDRAVASNEISAGKLPSRQTDEHTMDVESATEKKVSTKPKKKKKSMKG